MGWNLNPGGNSKLSQVIHKIRLITPSNRRFFFNFNCGELVFFDSTKDENTERDIYRYIDIEYICIDIKRPKHVEDLYVNEASRNDES